MSEYKKYPKVHRLGKEETDGILLQPVTIQEKIDGANISIYQRSGVLHCGTRTRELPEDESFNGFQEAVKGNSQIAMWLSRNPDCILYGEWLVKHTISYPDEAYRKIYLFDIYNTETKEFWPQEKVEEEAEFLGLEYPKIFARGVLATPDSIKEYVGKSFIAPSGEGVVIKNEAFKNKFGDTVYAKVVTEKFKESNAITFGGNNKFSDSYHEMYIVNKYCTTARVQKIMQKLQAVTEKRLDMEHTSRIGQTCYHDMITEDIWEIIKKTKVIDFGRLQRLSMKKYIQIYHDILNNDISIADKETDENSNDT